MIWIRVRQTDLLANTEVTLAKGRAWFDGRVLKYAESAPFLGLDTVELRPGEIVLMHKGETESVTVLKEEETGSAQVKTPYGTMSLSAKLLRFEQTEDRMTIEYEVLQGEEIVSHFCLKYDITDRAGGPGFDVKTC